MSAVTMSRNAANSGTSNSIAGPRENTEPSNSPIMAGKKSTKVRLSNEAR